MPDGLEGLLAELVDFGSAYAGNAKILVAEKDTAQILDAYQTGLTAGLRGLSDLLKELHNALPDDQRADVDRLVDRSGGFALLRRANERITSDPLTTTDGLARASDVIRKILEIVKDIIEIIIGATPDGPPKNKAVDWTDKILKWIRMILENIKEAAKGPVPAPKGGASIFRPWEQQLVGCLWFELWRGDQARSFFLQNPSGSPAEIDVEIDGHVTRVPIGGITNITGKVIRLHLDASSDQQVQVPIFEWPLAK